MDPAGSTSVIQTLINIMGPHKEDVSAFIFIYLKFYTPKLRQV